MALPSFWATFLAAIRAQESGGNYSQDSAGCLGAYCWNAQSNWDEMASAAGQKQYVGVNPSQVPAQVQDQVASHTLYAAYQQAGGGSRGLLAAAMVWNGGQPSSEPNPGLPAQSWAPGCGGGSSGAYACQVVRRMQLGGHYVAGGGSGAGGVVTTAAQGQGDCLIGTGNLNPIPSWVPGLGGNVSVCFLSKSQGRAILAVGNLVLGAALMGLGFGFVAAFTSAGRQVMTVVSALPGAGKIATAARAAGP